MINWVIEMIDFIHYEVKFGDTIHDIAERYNTDDILYYNHFNSFYPGVILKIPKQITNSVKKKILDRDIEFYLKRHLNKKHLFNFYQYKKLNKFII